MQQRPALIEALYVAVPRVQPIDVGPKFADQARQLVLGAELLEVADEHLDGRDREPVLFLDDLEGILIDQYLHHLLRYGYFIVATEGSIQIRVNEHIVQHGRRVADA